MHREEDFGIRGNEEKVEEVVRHRLIEPSALDCLGGIRTRQGSAEHLCI